MSKSLVKLLHPLYLLLLISISVLFYSNVTHAVVTVVTDEIIKAKINEVDTATELNTRTKAELKELYHKTLSQLEIERSNKSTTQAFKQARQFALQQTRIIRKKLEQAQQKSPGMELQVNSKTPTYEIEQKYLNVKVNLSAVEASLEEIKDKLIYEDNRPNEIRKRLTEVIQEQQILASKLDLPLAKDQIPLLIEARKWLLNSGSLALSTEIKALNMELLSQPMRIDLLKAKRNQTTRSLKRVKTRIHLLEELVNQRRRIEAEKTTSQTKAAKYLARGKHPLIQKIAVNNAELSEELSDLANTRQDVTDAVAEANDKSKEIKANFESARQKIKIAGLGQVLGMVLLEQKHNLPELDFYRKKTAQREELSIKSGLRQIQNKEELRHLKDIDAYIKRFSVSISMESFISIKSELLTLLKNRKQILIKLIAADSAYLRDLSELDVAQQKVLNTAEGYDAFLTQRLLWLRSTQPINLKAFRGLPNEISRLFAPGLWMELVTIIVYQLTHSISFILQLLLFGILFGYKRKLNRVLINTAACIKKISTDRFSYTLKALSLSLLLALPWPLLMFTIGYQLNISIDSTELSKAFSIALITIATPFFYLVLFRVICLPNGLAASHFGWPNTSLQFLRKELRFLLVTLLPVYSIAITTIEMQSIALGSTIVKIFIVLSIASMALFLYRVLHPRTGVLQYFFTKYPHHIANRLKYIWFTFLMFVHFLLAGFILVGYVYTAGIMTSLLFDTIGLFLILLLVDQMIKRWLLLAHRKLALQASFDRRAAARAIEKTKSTTAEIEDGMSISYEEPTEDLVVLSEESIKLVNTALLIIGIAGLFAIWSFVLPAFKVLADITVWHHSVVVNGVEQLEAVTLTNIGLAIVTGFLTVVLYKRLPALLEIVLLRRINISVSGRYTVTTITSYCIVAIGIILMWNIIGGKWEQIQWLAAALSLGIGFGLQEIVANFISGIIILFERPIRVGDTVTVGDTDGVVTRIQIRATTIRNFDRKELLVPNKEFITGRLLNWSLSDKIVREIISVGVAYDSDVDQALELMVEAAKEQEYVLDDPEPHATFEEFSDSSLLLRIRVYMPSMDYRIKAISGMHKSIFRKFNNSNITIAFPQMDVHFDSRVKLDPIA